MDWLDTLERLAFNTVIFIMAVFAAAMWTIWIGKSIQAFLEISRRSIRQTERERNGK